MGKNVINLVDLELDGSSIQILKTTDNSYVLVFNIVQEIDSYGHPTKINNDAIVISKNELNDLKTILENIL